MIVVVDASVGAKWLFPSEEYGDRAADLLGAAFAQDLRLHVPPLFQAEVANVVRQRMRRDGLPLADATALVARLLVLPVTVTLPDGLVPHALALAEQFALPAIYDAFYLALADLGGGELWTDDRRLLRQVGGDFHGLRWIGEYGGG